MQADVHTQPNTSASIAQFDVPNGTSTHVHSSVAPTTLPTNHLEKKNRMPSKIRDKRVRRPTRGKSAWARIRASIPKPYAADVAYGSDFASTITDHGEDGGWEKHKLSPYERDNQLADWNGDWGLSPIDWDNRPQAVEKHWHLRTDAWWPRWPATQAWETVPRAILASTGNEIAPMSWAVTRMDEKPFSVWWKEHTREPEVEPGAEPWFHFYDCKFVLQPLSHPISNVTVSDRNMILQAASAAQSMEQWEISTQAPTGVADKDTRKFPTTGGLHSSCRAAQYPCSRGRHLPASCDDS